MKSFLSALVVLILMSFCPSVVAQDEGTMQVSEAEAREKAVVDRFWSLLERAPRRGTSLDRVYGYYVDTGQMEQLIDKCVKLTDEKPDDAKAWLLLGLVLSRRNDDEGTIRALEKAEQLDTQDALASFYLGEALIAQGRLREAAAALERSVERKPQRADMLAVMQTLGRVYERFADKEKAGQLWSHMEELFPDDLDILVRIAETLEEEGKYDEALTRYQKLAELSREKKDNYGRVRFTLSAADIKIRLGNKQEAINDFDALLEELASDNWLAGSVRDRVERVFVRQADYAGLAGYYQKRLQSHPNDVETTRRLAVALVRLGRTDDAKQLLESTLEKAPSDIALRLGLIDLLVNDREFDRVDEEYAKINELDANNPDHISQWGLAALENRKLDEQQRKTNAAAIWRKLVVARPNDRATVVMVADLMAGGKINDEAETLYLKAVELAPNDSSYREYLGFFYHRTEQKDKAIATLRQIAEGDRRTPENLAMLANIFKSLGYADESLEAMRDAAESAMRNFELQLAYAEMLMQNDDLDAAKERLAVASPLAGTDDERLAYTRVEIELLTVTGELKNSMKALADELETATPDAKRLWQLAMYCRADGALNDATAAIEKALALDPASLMLLDTAADIYTKNFDEQRAADIYEKLTSVDAARRVDHLKRLANLQRDMGQTDKAIETARLVMATGAGNVANSRFYADMLISIGRRGDGIEALRRAVRIDPSDQVSLSALADQLAQDGQLDEAIEITWRIFDRTEDLQGKIGQVGKLSNYYQQGNRFDQLIARLQQNLVGDRSPSGHNGRREAAYCLAQAHAGVGDYFAARNALEMLLTNVDEVAADLRAAEKNDTFLLDQLSRVAEMQGDFASAIRYQEMLCDQTSLAQDRDRLLGLYYAAGEREKAATVYLQMVAANVEFADQISTLDKLLAREDYTVAKTLLERLEMKYPNNWELMYRRLVISGQWPVATNQLPVASETEAGNVSDRIERERETYAQLVALARAIRKLDIPDDELSAVEQKAKNAAQNRGGIQRQGGVGASSYTMIGGSGYSPWGFGQHQGYSRNMVYNPGDTGILTTWSNRNVELTQTLFRDRLQLEQYYYQRSSMMSTAVPEKPLFKPMTFADAKFAALAWELKFAWDQDVADFLRDFPEEAKLYKELPDETGVIQRGMGNMTMAYTYIAPAVALPGLSPARPEDNAEDDEQKAEEAKNRERVEKALKFERLFALVEVVEKEYPADSDNIAMLMQRLRFETFRTQLVTTLALDDEIILPLAWLKNLGGGADSVTNVITVKLGLLGEKDWKNAAFRMVLQKLNENVQRTMFASLDLDAEIAAVVKDVEDDEQRAELVRKIKERVELASDSGLQTSGIGGEENPEVRSLKSEVFSDDSARLDWLVEALLETAAEDPRQLTVRMNHYSNVMSQLPEVYRLLEYFQRDADIAKLDAMIDRLAEQQPQFYMLRIRISQMPDFSKESLIHLRLKMMRNDIERGENFAMRPVGELMDRGGLSGEKTTVDWKRWITKMKDAAIKDIASHSQSQTQAVAGGLSYVPSTVDMIQQVFVQQAPSETFLMVFGQEKWRDTLNQNVNSMNNVVYGGGFGNFSVVFPEVKKKLGVDDVEGLARETERLSDLVAFYMETIGGIKAEQAAVAKSAARPPSTPARQRVQSLSQYRYYFDGRNSIGGQQIRSLLNDASFTSSMGGGIAIRTIQRFQPDQFLVYVYNILHTLDVMLENSEPGEGVTAEQIAANHVERFKKYLEEKAASDDAGVAETAKQFSDLLKGVDDQQAVAAEQAQENDLDKLLAELETEYAETMGDKNLPPNKLLAMALIYAAQKKVAKVMECLDAMYFPSASDVKMRETIALQLYQQAGEEQPKLKARAEQAVDRLLGYQLTPEELRTVRGVLMQFDRREEADAIRDRLLVSAMDANTMGTMLQELRSSGEDAKEQTVQYALKVFRSPAFSTGRVMQPNSWEKHIRDQAIDILQKAGKLEEIVEQIEAQWKSSPGSFDIMTSLVEIYTKANRRDDAAKVLEQMQAQIPDDAQKMINFANLLRNFDRKDEAAAWMNKGLAKKPELFLNNYWEYQRFYRDLGQSSKLLEFLRKIDRRMMIQQSHVLSSLMRELLRDNATKDDARKFFDELWDGKDMAVNERMQIRRSLLQDMIWNPDAEFYPYLVSYVMEAVLPEEPQANPPRRVQPQATVVYPDQSVHNANSWSSDEAKSLSGSFVQLAGQTDKLDELQNQFAEVTAKHLETEEAKRDWQRYTDTRIFEALIHFKKGQPDDGLKIIDELREDKKTAEFFKQSQCEMTLGQILETLDDPKAVALAVELLEALMKSDRYRRSSFMASVVEPKLILLYLKQGNREKGVEKALTQLRQNLRYMKMLGSQDYIQINNNIIQWHGLAPGTARIGNALKEAGAGLELLQVYREMCEGQTWFTSLLNDQNRRYYVDQFKGVFDSLLESTSAANIAERIDMFIPMGDTQPTDEAAASNEAVTVPLFLGTYRKSVLMVPELLWSSKLFDALQLIAETDATQFAAVRESLAKLQVEHPDDPTVLLTGAWCEMLVENNDAHILAHLQRCADWTAKQESTEKISDQVLLTCWLLARQVYMNPDTFALEQFAEPCKTLSVFSCAWISRKVENARSNPLGKEDADRLSNEYRSFAPPELQEHLRATVSAESLQASLIPNGQLISNLNESFYDIEVQYLAAIKAGAVKEVIAVFETLFEKNWPEVTSDPHIAHCVFVIFDAVVDAAMQSNDSTEQYHLFDSLRRIVFAPESKRPLFFAVYDDLGGRNGYFRSPMIALLDFAQRTHRMQAPQLNIADKRKRIADDPDQLLMLDAMELAVALRTNDAEVIEKHVEQFLKLVRDEKNVEAGRLALVTIADQGIRPETLELLDASLALSQQTPRYAHFAYYVLRENMMSLIEQGVRDEGPGTSHWEMAVRWAERYRDICREADILGQHDGTRTSVDDRLLLEWEKCINNDQLDLAIKILKYFAAEPVDSFRYRDLGQGLDLLAEKLRNGGHGVTALPQNDMTALLGDLKLEDIARESTVPKDIDAGKPNVAERFDLPELPVGTLVYENDFEQAVGENWSTCKREITPIGRRGFLGEFFMEPVTFRLDKLPEHKFLRIRFDLFMMDGMDGLVGAPRHFGVDTWQMKLDNGLVPIGSSFSNYHKDPNNQKQSYPDDYPLLFGRKPAWYHRVESDSLWDDNLETGFYHGRHGAAEERSISSRPNAIYAIDMIVPHNTNSLEIVFQADFKDGPFEQLYHLSFGECWGLDNFRIETLNEPMPLTDDEMTLCFDALTGSDGIKANAARWRLVAAGGQTVEYVTRWFTADENASKAEQFLSTGNFFGFRIMRVLQLINTPAAKELRGKLFGLP